MIPIGKEKALKKALERQMVECEMNTVKEVLRRILGREPTNEDAKRCGQVIHEPWEENQSYTLTYDNVPIGVIKHIYAGGNFRVEFQSLKKAN